MFGEVSGADLVIVATALMARHWKHVYFVIAATEAYPEIDLAQSLTIWMERGMMLDSISNYSRTEREYLNRAIDLLAFRREDFPMLLGRTSPLRPLLIDLGNGLDLHPVSGAQGNPFHGIRQLQEWRNPPLRHRSALPREGWMRRDLFHLFMGTRYRCVEGNVRIRVDGRIITDLDAVIYDIVSGDIAIFQIKWQDYATNDVRELRSRAKNFADEMQAWSNVVEEYIRSKSKDELQQALRIKLPRGSRIRDVYMFGLSRTFGRVAGYGYEIRNQNIAISTWPQFARLRFEVGPVDDVFAAIHRRLQEESTACLATVPHPVTITVKGKEILFKDFWQGFEDGHGEDADSDDVGIGRAT